MLNADPHTLVALVGLVAAAVVVAMPSSWPAFRRAWRAL